MFRDWCRALRLGGRVGNTMPIHSGFRPSERFAALVARDLPVPETAKTLGYRQPAPGSPTSPSRCCRASS
jgi:hypothetical protein